MPRGRKKIDENTKNEAVSIIFNKIKVLMGNGCTRSESFKKIGVSSTYVYNNLTKLQKSELDHIYFQFSTGERARKIIGG